MCYLKIKIGYFQKAKKHASKRNHSEQYTDSCRKWLTPDKKTDLFGNIHR